MKAKYLFFCLLISTASFANDKFFYDGRFNFIQEYITELKKYQKEDINYRGAVVESLSGSFFVAFNFCPEFKILSIFIKYLSFTGKLKGS